MSGRKPIIGLELVHDENWTAGTIYIRNLIYCLAALPPSEHPEIRLLGVSEANAAIAAELRSFSFVDPLLKARSSQQQTSWAKLRERIRRRMMRHLIPYAENHGLDVTFPGFGESIKGAARIRWIPDLQHIRLPQYFEQSEIEARQKSTEICSSETGILVLSSQSVARDFVSAFPHRRITIRVWPFLTVLTAHERSSQDVRAKYRLPPKYLYLPNQFWQHKNHSTVFRAMARLKARGCSVQLVCTGLEADRRNPNHMQTLRAFIAEAGIEDCVHFLGLVPRADQIEVFRRAIAIVQPSLFEGWSTVVEDARALGRPLLVSSIDVHREQFAGQPDESLATFFEPLDVDALSGLMEYVFVEGKPGPDLEMEDVAAALNADRRVKAARAFLDIVSEAKVLHAQSGGTLSEFDAKSPQGN